MIELRKGRISDVNYSAGMARVVYAERENAVTPELPFLSFEYAMPEPGQLVYVLHADGYGLILGRAWSDQNRPDAAGKDVYQKVFGGNAKITYNPAVQELKISASKLLLLSAGESTSPEALLRRIAAAEAKNAEQDTRLAVLENRIAAAENKNMEQDGKITALGG